MRTIEDVSGPRGSSFRRVDNLILVAWGSAKWADLREFQDRLAALRSACPSGSAVLNVLAADDEAPLREVWSRMGGVFLSVAGESARGGPVHLGAAHLYETSGVRAGAARVLFRWMERRGRDFAKQGNRVVKTVDDAADWLAERLEPAPVEWTRAELRDVIAAFVHGTGVSKLRSA